MLALIPPPASRKLRGLGPECRFGGGPDSRCRCIEGMLVEISDGVARDRPVPVPARDHRPTTGGRSSGSRISRGCSFTRPNFRFLRCVVGIVFLFCGWAPHLVFPCLFLGDHVTPPISSRP